MLEFNSIVAARTAQELKSIVYNHVNKYKKSLETNIPSKKHAIYQNYYLPKLMMTPTKMEELDYRITSCEYPTDCIKNDELNSNKSLAVVEETKSLPTPKKNKAILIHHSNKNINPVSSKWLLSDIKDIDQSEKIKEINKVFGLVHYEENSNKPKGRKVTNIIFSRAASREAEDDNKPSTNELNIHNIRNELKIKNINLRMNKLIENNKNQYVKEIHQKLRLKTEPKTKPFLANYFNQIKKNITMNKLKESKKKLWELLNV